jgi:hypothetical protein
MRLGRGSDVNRKLVATNSQPGGIPISALEGQELELHGDVSLCDAMCGSKAFCRPTGYYHFKDGPDEGRGMMPAPGSGWVKQDVGVIHAVPPEIINLKRCFRTILQDS